MNAVLLVEDDHDLRDALGEFIVEICHRPCLSAASLDDVVALGDRTCSCGLAILDINLGPDRPSGVDVYEWLRAHHFSGRVAFLTGHAGNHPAVARAAELQSAQVYQKPVSLGTLRSVVEEAP